MLKDDSPHHWVLFRSVEHVNIASCSDGFPFQQINLYAFLNILEDISHNFASQEYSSIFLHFWRCCVMPFHG